MYVHSWHWKSASQFIFESLFMLTKYQSLKGVPMSRICDITSSYKHYKPILVQEATYASVMKKLDAWKLHTQSFRYFSYVAMKLLSNGLVYK